MLANGGLTNRSRERSERSAKAGGGEGIRTPGTLPGTAVFKTAAIDHSATPPSDTNSLRTVHSRAQLYADSERIVRKALLLQCLHHCMGILVITSEVDEPNNADEV